MLLKHLKLQIRFFLSMLLIVIIASALIISVAIYQYKEQAKDYHENRLERKENAIKRDITYQLESMTFLLESRNPSLLTQRKINEISKVHKLKIRLYNLEGNLFKTSLTDSTNSIDKKILDQDIVENLINNKHHRIVTNRIFEGDIYKTSYSYIYNEKAEPIGILNIPYLEKSNFYQDELNEFLKRISLVFLFMFFIASILAYFISKYITHSIKTVIDKMNETQLDKRNEKIVIKRGSEEIHNLVKAYNGMIDQLEESAVKLAKGEREQAWREMAKQVAHEIKNPLTPMRLTVQSFQRRFDPKDPDANEKIADFSKTIIQQIDTMTTIASAFSDFAKMPTAIKRKLNIVEVVKHAVEIFSEPYILFFSEKESIIINSDKTQIVRVITNLVTNANQALTDTSDPKIEVHIKETKDFAVISVADNGKGIDDTVKDRIFEPKFTTKSSGMGLGLPMVKNIIEAYGGSIDFVTSINKGTVFTVKIPKE